MRELDCEFEERTELMQGRAEMARSSSERERAALADDELKALIAEARDHQRRRRARVALAILAAVAAALGLVVWSAGGGHAGRRPVTPVASPEAVGGFLARAQRAADGRFTVVYRVTIPYRHRRARAAEVSASQLSASTIVYRETPAFSPMAPNPGAPGTAHGWAAHGAEVFASSEGRHGIFTCTQQRSSSPWACQGPDTQIAMGGTAELLGPYPPQALLRGLQNAAATYAGKLAIKPEPAYLLTERVAGRELRCLRFGRAAHPLGSVCLNPDGVIASYQLSPRATSSTYSTATLVSYSTSVGRQTLLLPAEAQSPYPPSP